MVDRRLFWSSYEPRNFGDWIGPYLFRKMTGQEPIFCSKKNQKTENCVFSVGSIVRHIVHPDRVTVWGSGVISRQDVFERPLKTLAVRGPETRDVMIDLGYECPEVFGDPAVLLPLFYRPIPKKSAKRIGIIPHFIEFHEYNKMEWKNATVIDVCRPVEEVIEDIASIEFTYSSSLHGLIVSHTYGVPSIWMESSKPLMGDGTKFHDYYASCGISSAPRPALIDEDMKKRDALIQTIPNHEVLRSSLLNSLPDGWRGRGTE